MEAAGLPTARGSSEPISEASVASELADEIGYPVIIKAAAGGGGIGMQIVEAADEFESALKLCQSRAKSAFGDSRVFVEKYIQGAQHVEFQVLADGNKAIHFGERFCSIQRRHQKLVEEGPWLTPEKREEIGALVCRGAESVGYKGLATFEFLRDANGDFYFLEVNPRVQVEHTVTELITWAQSCRTRYTSRTRGIPSIRSRRHYMERALHPMSLECRRSTRIYP
jgi:acetyl/propionyl-CoA carboxylase alpha subunit